MGSGSLRRQMEKRQIKVVTLRERKKVKPIKCIEQKETKLESEKRPSLSNGIKLFFQKSISVHHSKTHYLKAIKNYQDFFLTKESFQVDCGFLLFIENRYSLNGKK